MAAVFICELLNSDLLWSSDGAYAPASNLWCVYSLSGICWALSQPQRHKHLLELDVRHG